MMLQQEIIEQELDDRHQTIIDEVMVQQEIIICEVHHCDEVLIDDQLVYDDEIMSEIPHLLIIQLHYLTHRNDLVWNDDLIIW